MSGPELYRAPRGSSAFSSTVLSLFLGVGLPFLGLALARQHGLDFSRDLYIALLAAGGFNALLILLPALLAAAFPRHSELAVPYPPASALILANVDDDRELLQDTIDTLLRTPYPGPFQILLVLPPSFNLTPDLERLAQLQRNFHLFPVDEGTGERENLVKALRAAAGEIVAFFVAGQRPGTGSFARAWDWLCSGFSAIAGRSLAGDSSSWISRWEAIERASSRIPAESQRLLLASLDSLRTGNTYWRMDVARRVAESAPESGRWKGRRAFRGGFDEHIIAWQPVPINAGAAWRRAVSSTMSFLRLPATASLRRLPGLGLSRRLALFSATAWQPLYAWLGLQILTLTAFWAWRTGSVHHFGWLVPIAFLLALYALAEPVLRTLSAFVSAPSQLRRHKLWFAAYLVGSVLLFTWFRQAADRAAQFGMILGTRREGRRIPSRVVKEAASEDLPGTEVPPEVIAGPEESETEEDEEPEDIVAEQGLRPPIDLAAIMAAARSKEKRETMTEETSGDRTLSSEEPLGQSGPIRPHAHAQTNGPQVVEAANKLTAMIQDLVARLDQQDEERRQLHATIQSLQQRLGSEGARSSLSEVREHPLPEQDLEELTNLMDSLVRDPSHIVTLASVSQHAAQVAEVIGRYGRIQRELHRDQAAESA